MDRERRLMEAESAERLIVHQGAENELFTPNTPYTSLGSTLYDAPAQYPNGYQPSHKIRSSSNVDSVKQSTRSQNVECQQEPEDLESNLAVAGKILLGTGGWGMISFAQIGTIGFIATVSIVLAMNPKGLATFHPSFMLAGICCGYEAILMLQPTNTPQYKRIGVYFHAFFMLLGFCFFSAGFTTQIVFKELNGYPHLSSIHTKLAFSVLCITLAQILWGISVRVHPFTKVWGGSEKAKRLWKFHRVTGYSVAFVWMLAFITGMYTSWAGTFFPETARVFALFALYAIFFGLLIRINISKLGFQKRESQIYYKG